MSTESISKKNSASTSASYNGLFKHSRDGVVYHNSDGQIVDANRAACEILGLSIDELLGRTSMNPEWRSINEDGSDFPGSEHPAMIALRTGEPVENKLMGVFHPKTKSYRWISVNAVPEFRDNETRPFQVFATFRDVTNEYLLNQHIAESEAQFTAFLNTLDEGVWFRDFKSGKLVFVNDSAARIFGISKEEFFEDNSNRYEDFIHHEDRQSVILAQKKHLATGNDIDATWRVIRVDNTLRYVRFRLFTFSLPGSGHLQYSAGLMSDITVEYLKKVENDLQREKAEELSRIKSNLLNTIGHEFRTPITGIIGFSRLLQESVTDQERKDFAENIEKSTIRLYKTLESILDYSVLEAKKVDLRPSLISIQESIKMVLERASIKAQEKELYFQQSFSGPDKVCFYTNILDVILKYLMDNAIKFTSKGGIRLLFDVTDEAINIQVHDTGSGIPIDSVPYIFEPFRQGSEGVARLYEGVGMGLAIVKKYLDSINGEIALNINDHGGSSIYVKIPCPKRHEYINLPADAFNETHKIRVLYAEDNQIMHLLVKSMLKDLSLDFAKNVAQTLDAVSKTKYDIILLDVNLGEKDNGIQLLDKIKTIPGYSDVPVVLITAYSVNQLEEMKADIDLVGYLSKPFSESLLKSAIRQFIPTIS